MTFSFYIFFKHLLRIGLFGFCCAVALSACDRPDVEPSDDTILKVGTYNLWCSHSRTKYLVEKDPTIDSQRFWKPSSQAVYSAVDEMDCDILAFQEICDSIYGKMGADTSLKNLMGGHMSGRYGQMLMVLR